MMSAGGIRFERKQAGRALIREVLTLIQVQQQGETTIVSIGRFDL